MMIYEDARMPFGPVIVDLALKTGWNPDDLLPVATRIGKRPWEVLRADAFLAKDRAQYWTRPSH
jgi:hypothetical protein